MTTTPHTAKFIISGLLYENPIRILNWVCVWINTKCVVINLQLEIIHFHSFTQTKADWYDIKYPLFHLIISSFVEPVNINCYWFFFLANGLFYCVHSVTVGNAQYVITINPEIVNYIRTFKFTCFVRISRLGILKY